MRHDRSCQKKKKRRRRECKTKRVDFTYVACTCSYGFSFRSCSTSYYIHTYKYMYTYINTYLRSICNSCQAEIYGNTHVPISLNKKVLVKVLQAARSGNETEFSRLLQELRKNRKRKTRKSKDSKLGMTSTPLHSPDYIMTDDDYYCQQQQSQSQQQQPPYQWCLPFFQIGAEEEIASKDDDARFPQYEEFKQFLLKRFQREFQSCDSNNNQMQDMGIMDLRTTPMAPNLQTMPFNEPSYHRANAIDDVDPLAIASTDRSSYHMSEGSSQGSFLLKRMLQAPVGANLGEIASSLFWASNLLDNSDTLTAESDSNVNEDRELDEDLALEEQLTEANATEYYLVKNTKDEYLMSDTNLMSQQVPNVLASDDQYRFSANVNNRQQNSHQNWTVTNVMEMPNSETQTSRMFHTIYHNNTDTVTTTVNGNLPYQYQTDTVYNGSQNFFNYGTHDTGYMTGGDMMATNDSSDAYYLQNYGGIGASYYCNVDTYGQNNAQQDVYVNDSQYLYPRFNQETNNPLSDQLNYSLNNPLNERLEQQQNNVVVGIENDVSQETNAGDLYRQANETMEPFWPKWTTQTSNNLENILNYQSVRQQPNYYSKLNQTSCVYCYVAPIVTQRSANVANGCSMKQRYIAEQRQHSFSSYWMLYDDTSQGMRMMNTSDYLLDQSTTMMTRSTTGNNNPKETTNDNPRVPINDVWINQYNEPTSGDDMNVQASDLLFRNVTAD
ncbi:uncharacterized protein LOC109853790 isoform X3 [Pseudomyrmex gracilis]|uniref:uncharacterized protein LOC109853790 isoform X3 n=1 Tax=Pseudomyrmex gracilis TaxID=219809 RepID=UPI0009950275|nr:uncharacterized protein LOC109853790 isoform X3 [Pseudomyrmex gracilis]